MYVFQFADILSAINNQQDKMCRTYEQLEDICGKEETDKFGERLLSALKGFVAGANCVCGEYVLSYENKAPTVAEADDITGKLNELLGHNDEDYDESIKIVVSIVRHRLIGTPYIKERELERV